MHSPPAERAKNLLQTVTPLYVPNLQEIIPEEYPPISYFKDCLRESIDAASPLNLDIVFSGLNKLFQLWESSRTASKDQDFHSSIKTTEYIKHSFPSHKIDRLAPLLRHFNEHVFQPLGLIALGQDKKHTAQEHGAYNMQGVWFPLESGSEITFANLETVEAATSLETDEAETSIDVFHNTSSTALDGILKVGKILCAEMAEEEGISIKSGEYLHGSDHERSDGRYKFVYTSGLLGTGYSTVRWFNEFPVIFGFNSADIDSYMKGNQSRQGENFQGVSANGFETPAQIPIELVRGVYAPNRRLEVLKSTIQQSSIMAPIYSLEAALIVRNYTANSVERFPNYVYRRGVSLIQDAKSIFEVNPIEIK